MEDSSNDMPLVANTSDIEVQHYVIDLSCNFEKSIFSGSTLLYLLPSRFQDSSSSPCDCHSIISNDDLQKVDNNVTCYSKRNKEIVPNGSNKDTFDQQNFVCILDCCQLDIKNVQELEFDAVKFLSERFSPEALKVVPKGNLNFLIDRWSLQIWKEGVNCKFCFPKFIQINYETVPEGNSLLWVKDQDNNPSVFTYGAWINNRALLPCQEPPPAMATWSASITVPKDAVVLMSGDNVPIVKRHNGLLQYFYYSQAALPMATLALAVGFWKSVEVLDSGYYHNYNLILPLWLIVFCIYLKKLL